MSTYWMPDTMGMLGVPGGASSPTEKTRCSSLHRSICVLFFLSIHKMEKKNCGKLDRDTPGGPNQARRIKAGFSRGES